jgi:hypothetical protein
MKKRTYGTGSFRKLPSGNYQLRYKGETEVIEAANDKAADRALRAWVDKRDDKDQNGPAVSMQHLFDLHLADLRRMKRKDIITVKRRIEGHLADFGKLDATKIRKTHIREYIDKRVEAGASNGTINRELSAIRRSLNLGLEEELVPRVPVIKPLKESDPRQGFVEEASTGPCSASFRRTRSPCGSSATSPACVSARSAAWSVPGLTGRAWSS